ncbi:MAG: amidase [Verrucomicrobia bacterium]|nr:amidase [Verrucomicrobiota bacterium]MCH8528275.1 amidase [Kiritimatiellia bacterium]
MTPDGFHHALNSLDPEVRRAVFSHCRPQADLEADLALQTAAGKPLAGELCLFKDNYDVAGLPTDASSTFLHTQRPGPHPDAALVTAAKKAGLTVAGKVHMNPFAYGLDGANAFFGDCPHPFLPGHCSGGSSSGSAWAVARGFVPVAFGTDTGGSVRVPAAYCGIFGFRMSPNEWARDGCFPLSPSYDSVGWFTRSADDMLRFSQALLDLPEPQAEPLRISSTLTEDSGFARIARRRINGTVTESSFNPEFKGEARMQAFNVLQSREAYEVHKEWIDTQPDAYDPVTRDRILRGSTWTPEQLDAARDLERKLIQTLNKLFETNDVLLMPVSPNPPPVSPMRLDERALLLRYTSPASLARLPVLTLPVISAEGPLGLQCILPPDRWPQILATLLA